MKRIIYSVGGKVTLFICTVLAITVLAASIIGIAVCAETGIYTRDKESLKNDTFAGEMYSDLYRIVGYINDNGEIYNDSYPTNFRYAVMNSEGDVVAKSEDVDMLGDPWKYRATIGIDMGIDASDRSYEGCSIYSFELYDGSKGYHSHYQDPVEGLTYYEVTAYVDESFPVSDDYAFFNSLIDLGYSYRISLFPIAIVSLIVMIVCFIMLMCVSGRRAYEDEVYPGLLNRVPFDVLLAVVGAVFTGTVAIVWELLDYYGEMALIICSAAMAIVLICIFLGLCMSVAARLKQGTLIKNTFIAMICRFLWRILKAFGRGFKKLFKFIGMLFREIPVIWKTVMVLAVVTLIEFIVIAAAWWEPDVILAWWFVGKLILVPAVMWVSVCLRRLQKAGEKLANGDLTYKADTRGIFWDFKRHAENLNSIADGMSLAVDERMKSERMKTELITNVSHDIKTPLTSIINYADLISREDCDREKTAEYAAVLSRQSDRLKRLIEDLVEASKAATGNLDVVMSLCDANIFLLQAVGEYEQKLSDAGLTAITTQPEVPVNVMADGRRMLRIFDNLMNNICKYAQPGTRVYLSLERVGQGAVITFKNTSRDPLNISADELMERFVRGDSSRNTEGNGLGLSIAKSLTELQGGAMELAVDGDLFKVILRFPIV